MMERTTKGIFCLLLCLAMMWGLCANAFAYGETGTDGNTLHVAENNEQVNLMTTRKQYYVTGTGALCGTDWHPCDPDNAMNKRDNTIWYKTYQHVAPGTYEFRVTDGTWSNTWCDNIPGEDYGGTNYVLVIDDYSDVTVLFEYTSERVITDIEKSSHSFTNYRYNLDAACGVDGTETATCNLCRETDTRTAPGTALNHAFEDGSCIHCGQKEVPRLPGDLTGDDELNIGDVASLYALIRSSVTVVDAQLLSCADLTGDGKLNIGDAARLYAHIRGTNLLA